MTNRMVRFAVAVMALPLLAQQPAAKYLEIDEPVREGDVKVTGRTTFKKVLVRVFSGYADTDNSDTARTDLALKAAEANRTAAAASRSSVEAKVKNDAAEADACSAGDPLQTVGPVAVEETHKFEVTLKEAVYAGACIVVEDGERQDLELRRAVPVRSVILDLARFRGYFTLGGAVSQYRQQFSQVDTFMGFTADARLAGTVIAKPQKGTVADPAAPLALAKNRINYHFFVDARIGVRLASTGSGESSRSGAAAADSSANTAAPATYPDQLQFGANQPGYFQMGFHTPIAFSGFDWVQHGRAHSFFIAPIVKGGVQTLDAPLIVRREITRRGSETDIKSYTTTLNEQRTGALPFYGVGARFGIYAFDIVGRRLRSRQVASDLLGYLDLTWGKSSAFRNYRFQRTKVDGSSAAASGEDVVITSAVRPRVAVEGRLKIPRLPAIIGVDVNIRTGATDAEPNELRFILGFRVDAQKALARVFGDAGNR